MGAYTRAALVFFFFFFEKTEAVQNNLTIVTRTEAITLVATEKSILFCFVTYQSQILFGGFWHHY